jgi:hypothetical protein
MKEYPRVGIESGSIAISILAAPDLGYHSLLRLASTHYPDGHNARCGEYLVWLYEKNPHGAGKVVAAVENDTLIGMMGLIPLKIRVGDLHFIANTVVNVLTHPAHRGKNLFVKMIHAATRYCEERQEWLIGHPNAKALPGWKRTKMHFHSGYSLNWIPPFARLCSEEEMTITLNSESDLRRLDFRPLIAWQSDLGAPVIEADSAFLIWRFIQHPTRQYRARAITSGNSIRGYAMIRRLAPLVDFVVDWQGDEYWRKGPPTELIHASLLAWPDTRKEASSVRPRRIRHFRAKRKYYPFFATPPSHDTAHIMTWDHLTFAATDFC